VAAADRRSQAVVAEDHQGAAVPLEGLEGARSAVGAPHPYQQMPEEAWEAVTSVKGKFRGQVKEQEGPGWLLAGTVARAAGQAA